jgi:hypothetical protein
MDRGSLFDSGRMNAMCSLSPISLQIAPLWIWLISTFRGSVHNRRNNKEFRAIQLMLEMARSTN